MRSFRFDPAGDLIRVEAVVVGPATRARVRLAFDTGSTKHS